ncbi:MAG TPA: hypothetical protein VE623_11865, partial [Acidimicrobiales bacterium]|nr:hypothetical protein [Acidimicrobiales bacterium]
MSATLVLPGAGPLGRLERGCRDPVCLYVTVSPEHQGKGVLGEDASAFGGRWFGRHERYGAFGPLRRLALAASPREI